MKQEKADFTGVRSTMLVTLYLRALDARSKHPILGDQVAADAVDRIEYDFDSVLEKSERSNRFPLAFRAKQLDEWTMDFLTRHPDATVLQLGCGLDSRAFRLDLPSDVRWFDVDFPDVIELRRKLYSEHDNYRMLASSVTESEWLEEVPADRPTLIIAEGLLMYLTETEIRQLLGRLTDRFEGGGLLFDGLARWIVRLTQRMKKTMARRGFPAYTTATRDGREIERWNSQFSYVEHVSVMSRFAEVSEPGYRFMYRMMNVIPATRNWVRVFRYEF